MDQNTLVEGGDTGLRKIADLFREAGFPVESIYMVRRTDSQEFSEWSIVAVMSSFRPGLERDFIYELVRLRREKKLPFIDRDVRFEAVRTDHIEASRLLEYARRIGPPPLVIRNAAWRGLTIEQALVAEDLGHRAEAA